MALGPWVREMLGRWEPHAADVYRGLFFSLDSFVDQLAQRVTPERVLEVGCGEGALMTRMARRWPDARLVGIDITPRLGRLFGGDPARVRFQQTTVQEFTAVEPATVDLVVICDVLHHVPPAEHTATLTACRAALRPGGLLVVKEWIRNASPIFWLGAASDRFISGDRVRFGNGDAWRQVFEVALGPGSLREEISLRPWRSNRAFVLRWG